MAQQRRMIYDSLYANSSINMLPVEARYLYIGLIVLADDDGKLRADPRYLRGRLFSYDENITSEHLEKWLEQLADAEQILLYEIDGQKILKHPNWKKYQRIRADMHVTSKLPNPLRHRNENVTEPIPNISKDKLSKDKLNIATTSVAGQDVNKIISAFEAINPTFERLFSNKTQRAAVERLIKKFGYEKVLSTVQVLPGVITQKFAPKITTPLELERDLGKLIAFCSQEKPKTKQPLVV